MGRAEPGVMGFALSIIFLCLPGYSGLTMKAIPIEQNAAQPTLRQDPCFEKVFIPRKSKIRDLKSKIAIPTLRHWASL